ncbi:MAG: hypothetical protein LBC91_04560, partial [Candidatus Accumulibacter sp.]|nr:hypothetical protein [Accumulibacter sp.]
MKTQHHSIISSLPARFPACLLAFSLAILPAIASGVPTDLSETPISGASSLEIKPNILFILDDSYSMDWTYLPDWAGEIVYSTTSKWRPSSYQSYNASFNGVAYNPEVRYLPPSYFDENGQANTTRYPSQTSAATGGWSQVPLDGYGIQSRDKVNLIGNAFYYQTVPGEYCADRALRNCRNQDAPTEAFPEPAYLRWCTTAAEATKANPTQDNGALPACQAVFIDATGAKGGGSSTYMYPRMPAPRTTRILFNGGSNATTTVSSIKVGEQEILSEPVTVTNRSDLAKEVAKKIHACATRKVGACTLAGYDAEVINSNLNQVVLYAPGDTTEKPVVTKTSGGINHAAIEAFAAPNANVPGHVKLVPITESVDIYPKAPSRTDCAADDFCSYAEEMTNYANWHAYYRTRMQAMKTASSRSFEPIGDRYRIGYFSINNNTGVDFQNIADFGGAHKKNWYDKLFAARLTEGADTPLRKALAQAGWLFAGKYKGQTLNGITAADPMQYYCQPNVAILSTDGYWNKDAGFTLANKAVGDQDGPSSGEPRPILDGGLGLRTKRTERWYKTIAPQDYTWLQKQEEEWVVDKAGYKRSTKSQNQSRSGQLRQSKHEWRTDKWVLKKSVYTDHWWYNPGSVTKWKTTTTYLRKYDYELQKQIVQREKRTNTNVTFVMGQLQRLPKQMYRKVERDLYKNVKQVYRSDKQGTGYSDPYQVDSCTDNGSTICTYDDNNNWVKADSCTAGGRGKIEPSSTTGDNKFTVYETKTSCGYRYSPTVEIVPTAEVNKLPLVASCTRQGDKGSPFTEPHEVDCRTVSGAENYAAEVAECTVDADYTCRFIWETERQLWTGTTSDCVTYQGGGSVDGSVWKNPGKICYFAQYTPWTAVSSCTPGTVDGVKTECRDNPVIEAGVTDSNGWKGVEECKTTSGQYDTNGKRENCQRKLLKTNDNVSSCTWTSTGRNQYECEWYGQTSEQEVDQCGSNGSNNGNNAGGTWTGPLVSCTPMAFAPTCVKQGGKWYFVDQDGKADTTKECEYSWTGWSGFYSVGGNDSCTPIGTNRRNAPQIGDTQCRYEADSNNAKYSQTVPCQNSTNPPAPPSGWNNPTTFPEGVPVPMPEYRACYEQWTTPSTKLEERKKADGSTEYYCTNDGVYSRCDYSYGSWVNVNSCTPVAASSGKGEWTVVNPVECDMGFKVVDGFVEDCTEEAGVTQCDPFTLEKQPITDPAFDPDAPGFVTNDGKNYYRKIVKKGWYSFDSSGRETTAIPVASEADPAPSNAGFCEVNPPATSLGVPGEKRTYGLTNGVLDKRKVITCRAVRPNQSSFYTDACPGDRGSDPNANTTDGEAPSADNDWVRISCSVTRSGPTTDYACGKITVNGVSVMVNEIPATSSNSWVRTICSPGHGDPTKDTLADVAEYYYVTDLRTQALGNCTGAPILTPGGAAATYDVCADTQGKQKMSTYTLGLGASGVMQFEEGYEDETKQGDFYSIWKGVVADPDKGVCSWQRPGTECNWPRPENNSQTNIDDLWHAAVNGRGIYFSAENPKAMATGISAALQNVTAKMGSLSAVTTAGPRLDVDAESAVFQVSFTAGPWTGEVQKFKLTHVDGALKLETDWSAAAKLGATPYTGRTIFTFDANEAGNRKPFEWGSLGSDQKKYFQKPHVAQLSQLCEAGTICIEHTLQNDPNFGEKLVNFLRGDRSNEGETNELSKQFR